MIGIALVKSTMNSFAAADSDLLSGRCSSINGLTSVRTTGGFTCGSPSKDDTVF